MFDIFCISVIYLNSSITEGDESLQTPRSDLITSDHLSKNKTVGAVIYYNKFLSLKLLNINCFK